MALASQRPSFVNLLTEGSANDLRIGARFSKSRAKSLHSALAKAAETIDRMPSNFITYTTGDRILPVERYRFDLVPHVLELHAKYLERFGWMRVPAHLWRAMRRNAAGSSQRS
jgi:hypothetical protein